MKLKLTLYKMPSNGQWRWNLRARNGRIIGASTEAYRTRGAAIKNIFAVTSFFLGVTPDEKRSNQIVRTI